MFGYLAESSRVGDEIEPSEFSYRAERFIRGIALERGAPLSYDEAETDTDLGRIAVTGGPRFTGFHAAITASCSSGLTLPRFTRE